jgi:hypothetical protein
VCAKRQHSLLLIYWCIPVAQISVLKFGSELVFIKYLAVFFVR